MGVRKGTPAQNREQAGRLGKTLAALLLILALTACAGGSGGVRLRGQRVWDAITGQDAAADTDTDDRGESFPDGSGPAEAPPDLCRYAHIDPDAPLVTVDGQPVPGWQYLYWFTLSCDHLRTLHGGDATDWTAETDGISLGEQAKAAALSDAALYAEIEALAARYGVAYTAEDAAAVEAQWAERCRRYGGEAAYCAGIARFGLDRERALSLFRTGHLYGKLCALCRSGSALTPDEETLSALSRETVRVDRIFVASGENRNAARARAELFFTRLNGASDQAALFAILTQEGDDHRGPRTLGGIGGGIQGIGVTGDNSLGDPLSQVARALDVGELSGIIGTEDGFSILLRLPPDRTVLLDAWLDRTLEKAVSTAEITVSDGYAALDTPFCVAALEQYRRALAGV